jgi:hypothetical protein
VRVLGDVFRGRQGVFRVFQLDQASLLQQDQGTAAVAAFVRDGNGRAIFQFSQGFDFLRVATERFNVNTNAR